MKTPRWETSADLPGRRPVVWRTAASTRIMAGLAAICWPPLILTLILWPPRNWRMGGETDWRLVVLAIGVVAVPLALTLFGRRSDRSGRPMTRIGVVWRFILYGGVLAAALQIVVALLVMILGWLEADGFLEGLGATETNLLIYGVGLLPVAITVGVSYALWAGLCVAFIAFKAAPEPVRDRMGVIGSR